MPQSKDVQQNYKGALAYLFGPVSGIILLLTEKKDAFVRFHAMQSTVVFGGIVLLYVVLGIIPVLGWLVALMLSPLLSLLSFVLWIVLMFKAYKGEEYKLPYFGELSVRQLAKLK